jgi:hypothetical protein
MCFDCRAGSFPDGLPAGVSFSSDIVTFPAALGFGTAAQPD